MKRKLIFKDNINKEVIVGEVNIREKSHLEAQIKFPSKIQQPKKGKGSYKRNNKKVEIDL